MRNVRPRLGVLHGHRANVPLAIEVEDRILIQVLRFSDFRLAELDIERVGVLKVFYLHGGRRESFECPFRAVRYATLCILLAKSRPDVGGGNGFPSLR